jgi:alpha-1,3-rhamnosyl/mannosyltransferase
MKSVIIEASVLEQDNPSGVSYFTDGLSNALDAYVRDQLGVEYLWLNFLKRKQPRNPLLKVALENDRLHQLAMMPQRIYAKLVFAGIAPPLFVKKTDWSLFPNFYTWPLLPTRKTAVVIHDICFLRYPEYVEEKNRKFLSRTVRKSVRKADLIIAVSEFTKRELMELLSVPEQKILVIDIPVNAAQFSNKFDKGTAYLKERFGITKEYIFGMSTLEPRKNFGALVEAYCQLPKEVRDAHSLVIAGGWGWKSDELRNLIVTRQNEGYDIILTGHVSGEDRVGLFKNAKTLAFPSHYEGFGMPILEAFYCGIPVVAADIPVLREVGNNACLWSERDAKSLAKALQKILSDTTLRNELSRKGKERASDFSWEKTAKKLATRLNEGGR